MIPIAGWAATGVKFAGKADNLAVIIKNASRPGRLGGVEHQTKVIELMKQYQAQGYHVVREVGFSTPGGTKSTRFADLFAVKSNEQLVVQVGKQTKGGNPPARELAAIADFQRQGLAVKFFPYNK